MFIFNIHNYSYYGALGFQMWPFVATVGTLPIYFTTGLSTRINVNSYLPEIKQIKNIALVKYDYNIIAKYEYLLKHVFNLSETKTVFLHFPKSTLDDIIIWNNWIIGNIQFQVRINTYFFPIKRNANFAIHPIFLIT